MITKYKDFLFESRSHKETNVDYTFNEYIHKLIYEFGINDLFVSFRKYDDKVTDINPTNHYDTPSGFYTYPLSSFGDEITDDITERDFRALFPYNDKLPYIYFFVLKNKDNILDDTTPKEKLDIYAKRIKSLYKNNADVKALCNEFLSGDYDSMYAIENDIDIIHDTHLFWVFLFDICEIISKKENVTLTYTILCNKIGVNGFADYTGEGYIHHHEPHQAVFFKVKTIGELFLYKEKIKKRYDNQI